MDEIVKICLVEDNIGDQKLFLTALKLKNLKADVNVFSNGRTFLEHIQSISKNGDKLLPHLIVLDVNLLGFSGLEILQTLKKEIHFKQIPTVLFSGAAPTNDPKEKLAEAYVIKSNILEKYVEQVASIFSYAKI